jgi:glucose 1-dehydrogenase
MNRLENKKVLVTGASRGIGRAIALRLAQDGAELAIHYHKEAGEAEAVAGIITKAGGKASLFAADLSDPEQAVKLGEQVWKKLNGIDVLINNAGVSYKKHFLDTTLEDIDHFTNINFRGTLLLTQTIAKQMVLSKIGGNIYTITSINGIQPGVGLSVYGATKGALETLMKGIALDLAPHNIRVNSFAIGAIQTDINAEAWQDPEKLKMVNENIPLGRMGQPEEVAAVICDLLYSGTYLTGATIVLDGGWMLKQGYAKPKPYEGK